MKSWTMMLAAVTALSLAAPLAAADQAGRTPLTIDVTGQGHASGSAAFTLSENSVESDSGRLTYSFTFGTAGKNAQGQYGSSVRGTDALKGKLGQLVIRSSGRTFEIRDHLVWTGTWSIASGTGKYADLKGGGGFVAVITTSSYRFSFRYEGFVTRP